MSAGRTAQSLTQWAKLSLTALAQAKSQRAYDATFDAFFARYMNITVNGVHVARDIFKQKLFGEHVLGQPAKIEFRGATEMKDLRIPGVKGNGALVGLYYTATFTRPILVLGSHQQSTVSSSLNLVISEDPVTSTRKVVALNQITTERTPPVHIPGAGPENGQQQPQQQQQIEQQQIADA